MRRRTRCDPPTPKSTLLGGLGSGRDAAWGGDGAAEEGGKRQLHARTRGSWGRARGDLFIYFIFFSCACVYYRQKRAWWSGEKGGGVWEGWSRASRPPARERASEPRGAAQPSPLL